jgi:S-layer homology domain
LPSLATFGDVPKDHPFYKFIEALYASGLTAGCSASPSRFCPDEPVTRGQMAVMLSIGFGFE